jgi:hypothetical protein
MRVRLEVLGVAAAVSLVVGLLLVSPALAAARAASLRPSKSNLTATHSAAAGGPVATAAGGINADNGDFSGHVTNLTPYTWTLAQQSSQPHGGDWDTLPGTVKPTDNFDYKLHVWSNQSDFFGKAYFFNSWVTYRADTPKGTEYLTIWVHGCWSNGLKNCGAFTQNTMAVDVSDTTAPPYKDMLPPTPSTNHPAITWQQSSDWGSDVLFQVQGNYTLDASTGAQQQLAGVLNVMCAGSADTSCTFTATGPLTFKLDQPTASTPYVNMDCSAPPTDQPPPSGQPPDGDADWREISVTESREASIAAGVDVAGGVDTNVLNAVDVEVLAKFGVEREWSDTTEITKAVKIFVPRNWIGGVWTAPVVGTVNGTLQVSTKYASYTITNFTETKEGVSPDDKTPPFDVITYTRPLTMDEWQQEKQKVCGSNTAGVRTLTDGRPRLTAGRALAGSAGSAPELGTNASAHVAARAYAAASYPTIDGKTDPRAAALAINQYCDPVSKCTFVGPPSPTLGYDPPRATGDAVFNCGQSYSEDRVEVSDERSESTSLGESVSLSVKLGIFKAESDIETKELEKVSSTTGETAAVTVAPDEKGWIDTQVPTATATGYITDGIHFEVTNFSLFYPGYRAKGSDKEVIYTGVHEKFSGNEQGVDCSQLKLSLPSVSARGASPGLPVSICRFRRCITRLITLGPLAIRPKTRMALARGTRIYATGTAGKTRIVLHARRGVPLGRYLLILIGPHRSTMLTVALRRLPS